MLIIIKVKKRGKGSADANPTPGNQTRLNQFFNSRSSIDQVPSGPQSLEIKNEDGLFTFYEQRRSKKRSQPRRQVGLFQIELTNSTGIAYTESPYITTVHGGHYHCVDGGSWQYCRETALSKQVRNIMYTEIQRDLYDASQEADLSDAIGPLMNRNLFNRQCKLCMKLLMEENEENEKKQ